MLARRLSVFGAIFLGMWEHSAGVVILGTLDGLHEAQQRAAAKKTNDGQRRRQTWRTPVRVRKAKPIWNRIAGWLDGIGTCLALAGPARPQPPPSCFETRSSASTLSRHRVTASPRLIAASASWSSFELCARSIRVARLQRRVESSRVDMLTASVRTPKCCPLHAAAAVCRSSSAQPCKVLMTTTPKKPSVCCPPHPCAARVPPLPSPAQVFIWACQTAVSALTAARCALTREEVPGAAALPSHHLPGTQLFLDTAAHEPQELCSNKRPRCGCSPALAPNRLAVAVSPRGPAPLVACQPCLMALGAAAEWTASRSPSCTLPLQ
jgi:hypothetical protein